jgi:hypothetical protein
VTKKAYYQFHKEIGLPIFIALDTTCFDSTLPEFLVKLKFVRLTENEEKDAIKTISETKNSRCLMINEASLKVSKQIYSTMESDRFGDETIFAKDGYRVYRQKNLALMVYSFGANTWELGTYRDFGSKENHQKAMTIINRFLSLALAPIGIVGFFGVTIDEGMVVQRMLESKGEVVFLDLNHHRAFTLDGVKRISPKFKILRLDPTIKGRNIKMSNEEYLSFLTSHVSYFDYTGLSIPVRQMVQAICKMTEGLIHPEESFRPRIDLSL